MQRWKDGKMECACRDMAIYVRQSVKEEIAAERPDWLSQALNEGDGVYRP